MSVQSSELSPTPYPAIECGSPLHLDPSVGATLFGEGVGGNPIKLLAVNVSVATVLGSIPVSSDKVESEGRQMKQC